jgi:hypothetical protein
MKTTKTLRKLKKEAGQETEAMRDVKNACLSFAVFLNEGN